MNNEIINILFGYTIGIVSSFGLLTILLSQNIVIDDIYLTGIILFFGIIIMIVLEWIKTPDTIEQK